MLGGVHLRMENFQESWLMSQQAGVSGLCEKFHLYRLEKLVAISIVVVLLFYVHGKHLRSCRDGQLT